MPEVCGTATADHSLGILPAEQQRRLIPHNALGKTGIEHGRVDLGSPFDKQTRDTELPQPGPERDEIHVPAPFREQDGIDPSLL
jgi:hypothetical protein